MEALAMNEPMHLVAKGWYRLYYGLMLGFGVLLVGGSLAVAFVPKLEKYASVFGLNATMCIIAGALVVYCLTFFFLIAKRSDLAAILGAGMILPLVLLYIDKSTEPAVGTWAYVGLWLISVFLWR